MNYEKLIKSIFQAYKAPSKHIAALEPIFWQTLLITTPILYIKNLMDLFNLTSVMGNYIYIIYLALLALAFIFYAPFQAHIIQVAYHKRKSFGPIKLYPLGSLEIAYIKKLLWLALIIVGFACLSFLPYSTSLILIQVGSKSNIFTTFSSVLFLFGLAITIYMIIRTMGVLISAPLGKDITITNFFKLTYGHSKSIFIIILLSIAPAIIVAGLVDFSLDTLIQSTNIIILQSLIALIQSSVRAVTYLLSSYILWVTMIQYMGQQKII